MYGAQAARVGCGSRRTHGWFGRLSSGPAQWGPEADLLSSLPCGWDDKVNDVWNNFPNYFNMDLSRLIRRPLICLKGELACIS